MADRNGFWDVTASAVGFYGIGSAILALILFVWVELDADISDNMKAVADVRIEIADMRGEMTAGFAKLENMLIREVYTNRENIYRLEQRLMALEDESLKP